MNPDADDQELVEALNRGQVEGFEILYRRYRDWVTRLAYRFAGNEEDALDVMQETFTYFLSKFPGFRLTARLTTFLYPAVKHIALRRKTKLRRLVTAETVEEPPARESADPGGCREELAGVCSALPEGQREVLLLRFVDDLSLEEIALALEIPQGTVKSRLHHALRALREDPRCRAYFLDP